MAAEEPTPMTRQCAWTGAPFTGKGYMLQTTDGEEMVSADAFMAPWFAEGNRAQAEAEEATPPVDPAPADTEPVPYDPADQDVKE